MDFLLALLLSFLNFFIGGGETVEQVIIPVPSNTVEVIRVIDGDTIVVQVNDKEQIIRYIGIDTPEPYRDGEPACFSLEASLRNKELVEGKSVRLESDTEDIDRYGRSLRYVYVGDVFVNAELVSGGYAKKMAIMPNTANKEKFAELEQIAREQNLGLWGACE